MGVNLIGTRIVFVHIVFFSFTHIKNEYKFERLQFDMCWKFFFKKKQRGGLAFLKRNSILDNKFCVEGSVSFLPLKLRFFFSLIRRNRDARVRISKKKYKFGQFLTSV